jgi:hypothetical protein
MPVTDPQVLAAVITAAATVIYVAFTAAILKASRDNTKATRDIFEAAYRPYVSIASVTFGRAKSAAAEAGIMFEFRNCGTVPAMDFRYDITVAKDGKIVPTSFEAVSVLTLFPGEPFLVWYFPGREELANLEALGFSIKASYRGVTNQRHGYEGHYRYQHRTDGFMPLNTRIE